MQLDQHQIWPESEFFSYENLLVFPELLHHHSSHCNNIEPNKQKEISGKQKEISGKDKGNKKKVTTIRNVKLCQIFTELKCQSTLLLFIIRFGIILSLVA